MNYSAERYRVGLGGSITPMVKYLIIANIAVFVVQQIGGMSFTEIFGLQTNFLRHFMIWQVFSYMFLHGGLLHLFFNMLILWLFGTEVEGAWGSKAFLKYYIICGIGAGVIQALFNIWVFPSSNIIIGASGAIYGILLAFALIDPEREITFLFLLVLPIHVKAKYLVTALAETALFAGFFTNDGVAHFAHLGGMLVGFLYLKIDWRVSAAGTWIRRQKASREVVKQAKKRQQSIRLRESVDHILDKINEVGYENLTQDEKALLKQASQQLSEEEESQS